ncbi:hypothetical protein [Brevundimonas faecalis]|uniref:DUF2188 domain-containing protein n=1 Tax=Brevundimonas faecalis TaxID=947378 RepID=A0ABV2R877_9CAUL
MRTVVVEPFGKAWAVRVDDTEPRMFARGRAAEEAAKDIAERLSAQSEHVEIHLFLRNGEKAARFICLPPVSPDDTPHLVGGSLLVVAAMAGEMTEAAA